MALCQCCGHSNQGDSRVCGRCHFDSRDLSGRRKHTKDPKTVFKCVRLSRHPLDPWQTGIRHSYATASPAIKALCSSFKEVTYYTNTTICHSCFLDLQKLVLAQARAALAGNIPASAAAASGSAAPPFIPPINAPPAPVLPAPAAQNPIDALIAATFGNVSPPPVPPSCPSTPAVDLPPMPSGPADSAVVAANAGQSVERAAFPPTTFSQPHRCEICGDSYYSQRESSQICQTCATKLLAEESSAKRVKTSTPPPPAALSPPPPPVILGPPPQGLSAIPARRPQIVANAVPGVVMPRPPMVATATPPTMGVRAPLLPPHYPMAVPRASAVPMPPHLYPILAWAPPNPMRPPGFTLGLGPVAGPNPYFAAASAAAASALFVMPPPVSSVVAVIPLIASIQTDFVCIVHNCHYRPPGERKVPPQTGWAYPAPAVARVIGKIPEAAKKWFTDQHYMCTECYKYVQRKKICFCPVPSCHTEGRPMRDEWQSEDKPLESICLSCEGKVRKVKNRQRR